MILRFINITILCFVFFGCTNLKENKELPIAKVGGKNLYRLELQNALPESYNESDSVYFAETYIQHWIKRQLLILAAEGNLSNDSLLQQKIESYRDELLIFEYKSKLMQTKFNDIVTESEIEAFYTRESEKFVLNGNIVRAGYYVFKKDNKPDARIKQLMISSDTYDINELEDYTFRTAKKVETFNSNWILLEKLLISIEIDLQENKNILKKNKIIEQEIGNDIHLLAIKEIMYAGELAPIGYVENQIREIILNKRKLSFLNEIQDSLYEDGLKYNKFRVFK